MYGYMEGYSDTDDFSYCPFCGEQIDEYHADGTGTAESAASGLECLKLMRRGKRNDKRRYD